MQISGSLGTGRNNLLLIIFGGRLRRLQRVEEADRVERGGFASTGQGAGVQEIFISTRSAAAVGTHGKPHPFFSSLARMKRQEKEGKPGLTRFVPSVIPFPLCLQRPANLRRPGIPSKRRCGIPSPGSSFGRQLIESGRCNFVPI